MKLLGIVVNYKAADYCIKAVRSIVESADPSLGSMVIVVVDNSRDRSQVEILEKGFSQDGLAGADIRLVVNRENRGFGRACNQAFDMVESDMVLLLNPDARLLPGALGVMEKVLFSHPLTGAVAPRIFWDDDCRVMLPPSMPPWFSAFLSSLGENPWNMRRLASWLWRRYALKYWQAHTPVTVSNLSGGAVLLKREAVERSGGLFDEDFFLYYEDTDLFHRLKKAGFHLVMEPTAGAVHYYDQCGRDELAFKRSFMVQSERIFYAKHGSLVMKGWQRAGKLFNRCHGREKPLSQASALTAPFTMDIPSKFGDRWLFEWSPDPYFLTAAARICQGRALGFSKADWDKLSPGRYVGRITSLKGWRLKTMGFVWDKKDNA
ncbi:MAG: glycosyltransferase family 2 protein [Desulfobacterium sp.]|nr:glycosyltransferase family 2 protein [Desulfobacterium sp.]